MHLDVTGDRLADGGPKRAMLMDFGDISAAVKPLIEAHLDHWFLNQSTGLEHPTSEALCQWVYERLPAWLQACVHAVRIAETCTSEAAYYPHT
jgi:6-pyruvoyltetrahydropterin/6-carboxytetrahydropterin synthase